ncbi:ATP-binding cassette domain-containing protein [Enterococcus faecalis]
MVGKSGSGKSIILNLLGLFDDYEQGQYLIDGKKFHELIQRLQPK